MSQAKVDKHKQEKYNRKKNVKKRNFKKIAAYVVATLIAIAFIGYTGYQYYEQNRPTKTIYADTNAISDYVKGLDSTETKSE